jgi:cbb3-type cytochrome oxidase maturation protein
LTNLLMLIPVALILGGIGLVAFLWALKSGQFDDLDGAAHRILFEDDDLDVKPGGESPKGKA